ncbi:MAG TPA: GntR family transcriptional regulator [Candidatus Defluviicoccus seviourii]|nr:GntR family transcriptional regulator [Candidatus Defluviicoccus seviourii]
MTKIQAAALSDDTSAPAYKQIEAYLEELLAGSDYGPGDRIPSERVLAEQLSRNRMTVRKAIEGLIARGMLERDRTSGTRIPVPRVTRPMEAFVSQGFRKIIQAGGGTAGNKLLHFEQARATAKVASRLKLEEGADIVIFRRLFTANDTPVCIETSHLPLALVPDLAAEDLMAGESLYDVLHSKYGIGAMHSEREIGVATCNELEARLLNLSVGATCLSLLVGVYDEKGRPIEFTRSLNHPKFVVFKTAPADASKPAE